MTDEAASLRIPASFRDPCAFVYRRGRTLYRQINTRYIDDYRLLKSSGLLTELQRSGMLVDHTEDDIALAAVPADAALVIRPDPIPFVTFPWEWSFSQLKAAALLTLSLMERALGRGMILKDASARNVQFRGTKPVFIDTASFERYTGGSWIAYRQFCEQFLLPLALRSYCSSICGELERGYPEGIPLSEGVRLLPLRARLSPGLLLHCFGHARFARRGSDAVPMPRMSSVNVVHLVGSLQSAIHSLVPRAERGTWSFYDPDALYGSDIERKKQVVLSHVRKLRPSLVWDVGANDGYFSIPVSSADATVIAMESDADALERCYRRAVEADANVLPFSFDFRNPTGGGGVLGNEFPSLFERTNPDVILLLGIVHHLCISQNVPLSMIADFCRKAGARNVLLEWMDPSDDRTAPLLSRKPVHHPYRRATLDAAFSGWKLVTEDRISATRSLLVFTA